MNGTIPKCKRGWISTKIIPDSELLPILFEALPAFEDYLAKNDTVTVDDDPAWILDSFGRIVGNLILDTETHRLPYVFAAIECLINHASPQMQDKVVYFFLERLWVHIREHGQRQVPSARPGIIFKWLGPRTTHELSVLHKLMPDSLFELSD